MSINPNSMILEFDEAASQNQGGRPIFNFSSNSESLVDIGSSQQSNSDILKQPRSDKNFSDLFDALQRPLVTLGQSQEVLTAQLRLLSQKVSDIQLNQISSSMNSSSSSAPSKADVLSSVSPQKAFFPAVDSRAQELHARVFQNIGSSIKPAYHKNTPSISNACFDDDTVDYVPKVNTDNLR
jgi:hypothetical protein